MSIHISYIFSVMLAMFMYNIYIDNINSTTSDISLLLILIFLFISISKKGSMRIPRSKPFFLLALVFIIFSITSINFQGSLDSYSLRISLSWLAVCFTFYFGYYYSSVLLERRVIIGILIIWFILVTFLLLFIYSFSASSSGELRSYNDKFPGGINGMLFSFSWAIALTLLVIKNRLLSKVIWLSAFTMTFIIALLLGSRQFFVAQFVFWFLLSSLGRPMLKIIQSLLITTVALTILGFSLLQVDSINHFYNERIDYTQKQLDYGSERQENWQIAINTLQQNISMFGQAAGYASKAVGHDIDNAYLQLLMDNGYLPSLGFIVILFYTLTTIRLNKSKSKNYYPIYSILIVTFTVFSIFNEIIREYFIWLYMGALIKNTSFKKNNRTTKSYTQSK